MAFLSPELAVELVRVSLHPEGTHALIISMIKSKMFEFDILVTVGQRSKFKVC